MEEIKKVDKDQVAYELALGQQGKKREDKKFKKLFFDSDSEGRRKLARCMKESWKELFESPKIEWYESNLSYETEFVNRIFDSGKGFMRKIGMTHSDLEKEYLSGKMDKEFVATIDSIKKNSNEIPRVIVLTDDWKTYSILDGARRALALKIIKKDILCYVGYKDKFKSFKHFN
jgi:hypothetical protein